MLNYKFAWLVIAVELAASINAYANNNQQENLALSKRYIVNMQRNVTFIGLGALELGRDWGIGNQGERNHPTNVAAQKTLNYALQQGINVIDTANAYHLSQQRVGEFLLSSGNRNSLMINSKVGEASFLAKNMQCKSSSYDGFYCNNPASSYDFSAKAIFQDVDNSLKALHTSYLDVAFIHFGPSPKEVLDAGDTVAALKQLKREGKIRYIGASIDDPQLAMRCINSGNFDAIEVEYNLLNQTNADIIALAHEKGLAVFVRGGLGTGLLTAKVAPYLNDSNLPYQKQIKALLKLTQGNHRLLTALELAFLYENKNISSVIIGTGSQQHLAEDIQLLNNFDDPQLLMQAKKLMAQFKPGPFTDTIDAYFAKRNE
jgi:aryl-alcohol dehydrogenase-like predicted oxidoreductase